MKIAHISDVHLGYRAYTRVNSKGLNQRESDVFRAFRHALRLVNDENADLMVIAGDMFHTVRPSNLTIQQTFRELWDFRLRCKAPVVIIGGNHDTPKSVDTGCILDLFTNIPDIQVCHHGFSAVVLPKIDAAVYCLPYVSLDKRSEYLIKPGSGMSVNVLAVHGAVEGVMKRAYDSVQVSLGDLNLGLWDYVAVGHYHIVTQIADNAYYSGAIEYTSTNIWEETRGPAKGFIIYDTDAKQAEHIPVPGVRQVIDLPAIKAEELSADELMHAAGQALGRIPGGLDGKIVRVVAEGFPRRLQKELDWNQIREWKAEALHLEIVLKPAAVAQSEYSSNVLGPARPLETEWEEFVGGLEAVPHGIDRSRLIELGRQFLAKAADAEAMA